MLLLLFAAQSRSVETGMNPLGGLKRIIPIPPKAADGVETGMNPLGGLKHNDTQHQTNN